MQDLESIAEQFNIKFIQNLSDFPLVKEGVRLISYRFAKTRRVLPVEESPTIIKVALSDPSNLDAIQELRLALNKEIEVIYCPKVFLEQAIETCYHKKKQVEEVQSKQENSPQSSKTIEGYDLLEQDTQNPVIDLFNQILIHAIRQKASDIHFEPSDRHLIVRFRIDGRLQIKNRVQFSMQTQLITRIKVMSKLDISEQRLPQDGRLKLKMGGRDIDFRVSTIPTHFGERLVLRILDKDGVLGLKKIGMQQDMLEHFEKLLHVSEGIILVTGPTGSGKTTTLYSAIQEITSNDRNIMTIEDPIEYKLPGIAQINVNPKIDLTFSAGLRHILRQDPDVIMIGEVRDEETAHIAIQSALTGHLVFSTLHTNDAPSAITRMAEMGIEPYLLSSSVIAVIAQRLVRKVCPHCRETYHPSLEELYELELEDLSYEFVRGKGCDQCFQTGYLGRIAIYELLPMTPKVKKQILINMDSDALREAASISTLRQSGARLVIDQVTTSEEVLRVTKMHMGE